MRKNNRKNSDAEEDNWLDISSGWRSIYMLVIFYSVLLILALHYLTIYLDFSLT
ncbi:uncharacterized protein METZ01_LOCUS248663 [marine metagenome]|uniref:Uncharacterized protein n=1 Tax=marine metagenome TaxID=408172 RepID=A0A382I990_9ZZZZ|tara:strand:+ start:435 stop:596 length:162 start_codon:yes stop_codon:yes gene_type:complete